MTREPPMGFRVAALAALATLLLAVAFVPVIAALVVLA